MHVGELGHRHAVSQLSAASAVICAYEKFAAVVSAAVVTEIVNLVIPERSQRRPHVFAQLRRLPRADERRELELFLGHAAGHAALGIDLVLLNRRAEKRHTASDTGEVTTGSGSPSFEERVLRVVDWRRVHHKPVARASPMSGAIAERTTVLIAQ